MTGVKLWLLHSNIWNHLPLCKRKKRSRLGLKMLSIKFAYKSYIQYICIKSIYWPIGPVGGVFANDPGDMGRVIPQRLLKWYLIPPCLSLSNIRYVSRVKWNNPMKGVALSPTPWCSRYWWRSHPDALDYSRPRLRSPILLFIKEYLALDNLKCLICHKTQPTKAISR